jgi:hypothetical protein
LFYQYLFLVFIFNIACPLIPDLSDKTGRTRCIAAVPLETAAAYGILIISDNFRSKAMTNDLRLMPSKVPFIVNKLITNQGVTLTPH